VKASQYQKLLSGDVEIPTREFLLISKVCASLVEIGQKNVNFGVMDKSEKRSKTIVIRNASDAPLSYLIRKSGSIASGDIVFTNGVYGVIPEHGKKEIEFMFEPSLPGLYNEKLVIENIYDNESSQTVTVKANIRQPANFVLQNTIINLGVCLINQSFLNVRDIIITNPSHKNTKLYEVSVDPDNLKFSGFRCEVSFSVLEEESPEKSAGKKTSERMMLTQEHEEEIEQLEQKLKIALRKGRDDKAKQIEKQLEQLRSGQQTEDYSEEINKESHVTDLVENAITNGRLSVTSTQNANLKARNSRNSIVFSISPRCIKTVKIYFKPIALEPLINHPDDRVKRLTPKKSRGAFRQPVVKCSFLVKVNAHKNTDIVKLITGNAIICWNSDCYDDELSKYEDEIPNLESTPQEWLSPAATPEAGKTVENAESSFMVEKDNIDLGNLELSRERIAYFNLTNPSERSIDFQVVSNSLCIVKIIEKKGALEPGDTKKIEVVIMPTKRGQQFCSCEVLDTKSQYRITVNYAYLGVYPVYIQYEKSVNFGDCYFDQSKSYATIRPYFIQNQTLENIYISAISNLAQQCFIFSDSNLTSPANELFIGARQKLTIYIAIQPIFSLSSNQAAHIEGATDLNPSEVRELIGGVKIKIYVKCSTKDIPKGMVLSKNTMTTSNLVHVCTETVKFTARIGLSVLAVSSNIINLGSTRLAGAVLKGGFWIMNVSTKMNLEYFLRPSTESLSLDTTEGKIIADSESTFGTAKVWIGFSLTCQDFGFICESIECFNLNNSSQSIVVDIKAMADPGFMSVKYLPLKKSHCVADIRNSDVPAISWNDVFLSPKVTPKGDKYEIQLQNEEIPDNCTQDECSVELINLSEELMHLEPQSDANLTVRWRVLNGAGFVVDSDTREIEIMESPKPALSENFHNCGPALLLHPKKKAIALISAPKPDLLSEAELQSFKQGKSIESEKFLLIGNVDKKRAIKCVKLYTRYCLSYAKIEPSAIDLGQVGHVSMWNESKFYVTIENCADISFSYNIKVPNFVDIISNNCQSKGKLQINSFSKVELVFYPRKAISLYGPGSHSFNIIVTNIFNDQNTAIVPVQFTLTEFELRFERLSSGSLILPNLTHPALVDSPSCDNWFVILNSSDLDVKFDLGFNLFPIFNDLVIVEILQRATNSTVSGPLMIPAKSSLEVKVRASCASGSRIISKQTSNKHIISPEGVTLGNICVSSKQKSNDESISSKMAELIPIRTRLVEGRTFSVSPSSLTFHTSVGSDDDDENALSLNVPQDEYHEFVITNLSDSLPVDFQIMWEYPIEMSSNDVKSLYIPLLGESNQGIVYPHSQLALKVYIRDDRIFQTSEDIKLHIYDLNTIDRAHQTINISIVEEGFSSPMIPKVVPLEDSIQEYVGFTEQAEILNINREPSQREREYSHEGKLTVVPFNYLGNENRHILPSIILKGCKKLFDLKTSDFNGLYELDLGQQDLSNSPLVRRLTLENVTSARAPFQIKYGFFHAISFLLLSKTEGILEPQTISPAQSSTNLSLTFNVSLRGYFMSYLIIENVANPNDNKFIRISYEVVAKQNIKRSGAPGNVGNATGNEQTKRVFDVYTHCIPWKENQINLGNICFDSFYTTRRIIICNRETVPLDFSLQSNIPPEDDSELVFSLSRTSARLFKSISVEPESFKMVYLRYWTGTGNQNVKNVNMEIYVNCRLVKDYQMTIPLTATCFLPQISISRYSFKFRGCFKPANGMLIECDIDTFTIRNQFKETLEFEILSDVKSFGLEIIEENRMIFPNLAVEENQILTNSSAKLILGPEAEIKIRIFPLVDELKRHAKHYLKVCYFK
jgi:hypothetical protein